MTKNRERTKQKLLQAVSDIVQQQGFAALGVNAVAQQAGVSKMLMYRYFDSYNGLLKEWALRHNFWAEVAEDALAQIDGPAPEASAGGANESGQYQQYVRLLGSLFARQADSLRASAIRREVIRWMLAEENEVSRSVMQQVEDMGAAISHAYRSRITSDRDLEAAVGVLIGGVYYLALVSDRTNVFNGIDLHSDEGWARIKSAIELMIELLFESPKE